MPLSPIRDELSAIDLSGFERRGSPFLAQLQEQERAKDELLARLEMAQAEGKRLFATANEEEAGLEGEAASVDDDGDAEAPTTEALLAMIEASPTEEAATPPRTTEEAVTAPQRSKSMTMMMMSPGMVQKALLAALSDARSKASLQTLAGSTLIEPTCLPLLQQLNLIPVEFRDEEDATPEEIMRELERLRREEEDPQIRVDQVREHWELATRCERAADRSEACCMKAVEAAGRAASVARESYDALACASAAAFTKWRLEAVDDALQAAGDAQLAARSASLIATQEASSAVEAAVVSRAYAADEAFVVAVLARDAATASRESADSAVEVAKSVFAAAVLGPAALTQVETLTLCVYDEFTRRFYEYKLRSNQNLDVIAKAHAKKRGLRSDSNLRFEAPPGRVLSKSMNPFFLQLNSSTQIHCSSIPPKPIIEIWDEDPGVSPTKKKRSAFRQSQPPPSSKPNSENNERASVESPAPTAIAKKAKVYESRLRKKELQVVPTTSLLALARSNRRSLPPRAFGKEQATAPLEEHMINNFPHLVITRESCNHEGAGALP